MIKTTSTFNSNADRTSHVGNPLHLQQCKQVRKEGRWVVACGSLKSPEENEEEEEWKNNIRWNNKHNN